MTIWRKKTNKQDYQVLSQLCDLRASLDKVKKNLNIVPQDTSDDALLTDLINACANYAQKLLGIVFLDSSLRLYLDNFDDICIEIRRRPDIVITSVKYINSDDVLTTVPAADYYLTFSNEFPTVQPVEGKCWPTDLACRKQAVEIEFTAGYGVNYDNIPVDLRAAEILGHDSTCIVPMAVKSGTAVVG